MKLKLALFLLMARVCAGNVKITVTTNGFALCTDFFYGCSYAHNEIKQDPLSPKFERDESGV